MSIKDNPIKSPNDLITPYEEIRAGFISLALEKSKRSSPFIEEAKALKILAGKAKSPKDLINIKEIRKSLLTASGLSNKAIMHLEIQDRNQAILNLIKEFLEPAGINFVEELVYRFLLTRGDSLGGSMRNIAGKIGEWKFIRILISTLSISGYEFSLHEKESRNWMDYDADADIEKRIDSIFWVSTEKPRTLVFNKNVPIIGKNVDLILFNSSKEEALQFDASDKYLALGEIKGGIDPAGADEHWKTANTALNRIREGFSNNTNQPFTFFIGAAIENSMAKEIFLQLQNGVLTNAANLTNEEQVVSICSWLINL